MIEIEQYSPEHLEAVIGLLRLNTPAFFAPAEEADLLHYLTHEIEEYFIVRWNGEIMGCGGINLKDDRKTGVISWDMIHPAMHGKGLGSALTQYRIKHLLDSHHVKEIIVRTTQLSCGFYEKQGFVLVDVVEDYWAEGYDLYYMIYRQPERPKSQ
jgi:ribosomal-protein-alanine N-acetyltransferase